MVSGFGQQIFVGLVFGESMLIVSVMLPFVLCTYIFIMPIYWTKLFCYMTQLCSLAWTWKVGIILTTQQIACMNFLPQTIYLNLVCQSWILRSIYLSYAQHIENLLAWIFYYTKFGVSMLNFRVYLSFLCTQYLNWVIKCI